MWETRIRRGREERSVWIEPDQMFGLSFSDKRPTQVYFLECDRGTMPVKRKNLSQTSFLRKFLSYADTRKRGLHTKAYGLSNFTVLTVAPTALGWIDLCPIVPLSAGHVIDALSLGVDVALGLNPTRCSGSRFVISAPRNFIS